MLMTLLLLVYGAWWALDYCLNNYPEKDDVLRKMTFHHQTRLFFAHEERKQFVP